MCLIEAYKIMQKECLQKVITKYANKGGHAQGAVVMEPSFQSKGNKPKKVRINGPIGIGRGTETFYL